MAKAESSIRRGDREKAEAELRKILEDSPGNLKASISLARLLKEQEKYAEAIEVLD